MSAKTPTIEDIGRELKRWRAEARLQRKNLGYVPEKTLARLQEAMAKAEAFVAIDDARERPSTWRPPMANPKKKGPTA